MKKLTLKLNHTNSQQVSNEGVKIQKFISSISPASFIKLLRYADNKVNPRIATVNKITKSIHKTLESNPELFWFKSKGILIATEKCEILGDNKLKISLENLDYEGIMDGGHNTFAIAIYIVQKLFGKMIKKWEECKEFWDNSFDEIEERFKKNTDLFKFSIPIEIITPTDQAGAIEEFYDYISEICSARNNNVQLRETAKGNQVGCYDYLKEILDKDFEVIWKTGDSGKIKAEDVISLASISLIYLKEQKLLPSDINSLSRISVYSQKSKCVDFFNSIIAHNETSYEEKGKYVIHNEAVKSALELTKGILTFFDKMYLKFPKLYHNAAPGRFGRISAVENKKSKAPFFTSDELSDYKYSHGFIYPLVSGITSIMGYDELKNEVFWKINPDNLDLEMLDLSQYVELIKMVSFDPQKIGKGNGFYNEALNVFKRLVD